MLFIIKLDYYLEIGGIMEVKKFLLVFIALVIFLNLVPANIVNANTKQLKVHFIDVGQGDAILIQTPEGKTMLVDGGPVSSGKKLVSFLKSKGVKKIDCVIATHPDADHIGGLISVLKNFPVDRFIESGKVLSSEIYFELLSLIDKKNIKFHKANTSDSYLLDKNMTTQVLSVNEKASDNDASIVLKLTYNEVSFLLMGDASTEIEEKIRSDFDVAATVLKVGNHGSDTSSSPKFISNVKPKVGILSYGKNNSNGHPDSKVVKSLKNVNSKIYKTATDCDITVTTNGVKYSVTSGCNKTAAKTAAKTPAKTTVKAPAKKTVQTGFKNCTELRKVYPDGVSSSHPAYLPKFDRDKDGWACER